MKDAIIKETGNSRYLRSIAGFLQAYPAYQDFAAALIAGTLPIDLAGINADGFAQLGTDLNKANLLTDATAALAGLGPEATPDQMFAALANAAAAAKYAADTARSTASAAQSAASSAQSTANSANNKITYGTADLVAGSSSLVTGRVYLVYE